MLAGDRWLRSVEVVLSDTNNKEQIIRALFILAVLAAAEGGRSAAAGARDQVHP